MSTRKEPYLVFYEIYRAERKGGAEHTKAQLSTLANWAQDHIDARLPSIKESTLNGFVETMNDWNACGTMEWDALRVGLRKVAIDTM